MTSWDLPASCGCIVDVTASATRHSSISSSSSSDQGAISWSYNKHVLTGVINNSNFITTCTCMLFQYCTWNQNKNQMNQHNYALRHMSTGPSSEHKSARTACRLSWTFTVRYTRLTWIGSFYPRLCDIFANFVINSWWEPQPMSTCHRLSSPPIFTGHCLSSPPIFTGHCLSSPPMFTGHCLSSPPMLPLQGNVCINSQSRLSRYIQ